MPKMNVINRPESTTVLVEIPFHLIRDAKELRNIYDASPNSKTIIIQKMVNSITFQPELAFMLSNNINPQSSITFSKEFYICSLVTMMDAGIDIEKWELKS